MLVRVAEISDRSYLKILSPKQKPQILPIALAYVKADNTFDEIHQRICSLFRAKEIARKVCNNTMNPIKL